MTNRYLIVVDCKNTIFDCYAKTLKGAKSKISKFIKNYPHGIESAIIYENHKEVYRK